MSYFRVQWQTPDGVRHVSDPLSTWLDAARFRSDLIIRGIVSAPVCAQIVDYCPRPTSGR